MALRLSIRHKPNKDLTVLPQVTQLFEQISKWKIGNKKPIIGKGIFKVEAGIHADGIIKNPATYEAYDPKSVGGKTEVVIGKHSGLKAIKFKLIELNMPLPMDTVIEEILHHVKVICDETKTSLTDEEFKILAFEVIAYEREQIYC
jgi:homocitrate synthase NifV